LRKAKWLSSVMQPKSLAMLIITAFSIAISIFCMFLEWLGLSAKRDGVNGF